MASKIKGLSIQIGGDTSQLVKAIDDVERKLKTTTNELNQVNKLLKLDPKNTELLAQKQKLVANSVELTNQKLTKLKELKKQADSSNEVNKESTAYKSLEHEITRAVIGLNALTQETKKYKEETDDAGKKTSIFGEMLKANLTMAVINGAVSALKTLGKAYVDTLKAGIEYNAQMETYTVMFTNLTGSAEKAEEVLAKIKADAKGTTFGTAALVQANQYLLSAGVQAEQASKTILALGNAVAATGGGADELKRMAQNLQQIKNVGKASSVDIKQFANAGINVYGVLSAQTGKTVKQLQEMDITYEQLEKALISASQEGGMYFNAMSSQAGTYAGQVSLLKSNWEEFTGAMAQSATGALTTQFLPAINQALSNITSAMNDTPENLRDTVTTEIGNIFQVVADNAPEFLETGASIIGAIASGIVKAAPDFFANTLPDLIISLGDAIDFNMADLIETGGKIMAAIGEGLWKIAKEVWHDIVNFFSIDDQAFRDKLTQNAKQYSSYGSMIPGSGQLGIESGGFAGLMASGGTGATINLQTSIVVNNQGQPINEREIRKWGETITDIVSTNLGRRI